MRGTVKYVNFSQGYAFITGEDHVQRFAHSSSFEVRRDFDLLREGQGVEFDHVSAPRGPRAINVRVTK